jgi:RNA polymerase sigma factor for flagellar operon FliA
MTSGSALPPDGARSAMRTAGQPTAHAAHASPANASPATVNAATANLADASPATANPATANSAAKADSAMTDSVAVNGTSHAPGQPATNGHVPTPLSAGAGQLPGVLPGDHRSADDVEAGIVALWRQYGDTHDQGLRDRLMMHYAPLVKYVAGRVGTGLPAHVDVADLVQSGIFGLADAIEKFEPERGLKFETYAMQRIRGAILDELRSQDWVPRSVRGRARDVERALERLGNKLQRTPTDAEIAAELQIGVSELHDLYAQFQLTSVVALDELMVAGRGDTSLAETLPDDGADDPVASLVDRDNRRQLADAIAQLSERDRIVVSLYYFENLTLAEIGKVLKVTESRVCQLHTRAVLRLRTKLAEQAEG